MRRGLLAALTMIVAVSALVFSSQAENLSLRGDYVEVRTASVFAGACHYNGEVVTTGRDAMMAWNVTSGKWQGVELAGVRLERRELTIDRRHDHEIAQIVTRDRHFLVHRV